MTVEQMFEKFVELSPWYAGLLFAFLVFYSWRLDRRREWERQDKKLLEERMQKEQEVKLQEKYQEDARWDLRIERERVERERIRREAGERTGGYIVVDLEDSNRRLFHDLLKGFEEYALLQGYSVDFSVDSTYENRIAFKFTISDPDTVIQKEKVRKDLQEYLNKISNGETFEDMHLELFTPESDRVLTTLKNRISFLQHSYNLEKNGREFYEKLIKKVAELQPQHAQQIYIQAGQEVQNATYSSVNSPQSIVGVRNKASGLEIGSSFNTVHGQLLAIDEVLDCLTSETRSDDVFEIERNLKNVKEELGTSDSPDRTRIDRWLTTAKQLIQTGSLGHTTYEACKKLMNVFGLSIG